MRRTTEKSEQKRKGAIAVLVAVLAIPLLSMVAFAVDYGYLLKVETDLQRSADAAALAAVQELIPTPDGTQDVAAARAAVRLYAASNIDDMGFAVLDADIEIGRFDPATIYSNVTLVNNGTLDAVRITLRRDGNANSPVSLFFGNVIGVSSANVVASSTAVLQKATALNPGADIVPFALDIDTWNAFNQGESFELYNDNTVEDANGNPVPGNWGTVDIGDTANSTSDLNDQMIDGLRQSDLDSLQLDGRIPDNDELEAPVWVEADPGLSVGLRHGVEAITGTSRIIPIYDTLNGVFPGVGGNTAEFHIIAWGVVHIDGSRWNGNNNTHVDVTKAYLYDGALKPQPDLSDTTNIIPNAFTAPVLVE